MLPFFTLFTYYWIICFAIIGYGVLFSKIFIKDNNANIGYFGLYGIFVITIISYVSNFFIAHSLIFNSLIIITGFLSFISLFNFNQNKKVLKETVIVFALLFIFIVVFKNHDDFSYYHFAYTHLLTEYKAMIGLGYFNHGFRTPSSIFYISSIFYLPFAKYFLFHLSAAYFLGFANLILYKKIQENIDIKNNLYLIYLSLFSIAFINIFFYRLGEHGTDRSAMILIFILAIETIFLINFSEKKRHDEVTIYKVMILTTLIFTLKAFYMLYGIFFLLILYYEKNTKKLIISILKNKIFYLCALLIICVFFITFLNTGCLIYPVKLFCFPSAEWSIPINEVELMNNHYQLWSKAGLTPNFKVDNAEFYIQKFNWVLNWIDKYFFNKVSDFLLSLILLVIIFFLFFFKKKNITVRKKNFYALYLILILLFVEWFYFHPALRYGGYHLIALLFFIPSALILEKYSKNLKFLNSKINIMILIIIAVFLSRNVNRIYQEYKFYNYNFLKNINYNIDENYFFIDKRIKKIIKCQEKSSKIDCNDYILSIDKSGTKMFYIKK